MGRGWIDLFIRKSRQSFPNRGRIVVMAHSVQHQLISIHSIIQPLRDAGDGAGGEAGAVLDLGVGNTAIK